MSLEIVPKPFQTRRSHTKSRRGCVRCRKRKVKCDETKPKCLNCTLRMQSCVYNTETKVYQYVPSTDALVVATHLDTAKESFTSAKISSAVPALHAHSLTNPISFEVAHTQTHAFPAPLNIASDLCLFDHYMLHTAQDSNIHPNGIYALQTGLPLLAAKDAGVLGSLIALGAACFCIDTLHRGNSEDDETLQTGASLIEKGDRYHQLALKSLRCRIASGRDADMRVACAHSSLPLIYSFARQRALRLCCRMSTSLSNAGALDPEDLELPDILDWTALLRGISTIGNACWSPDYDRPASGVTLMQTFALKDPNIEAHVRTAIAEVALKPLPSCNARFGDTGCHHPLFTVVAATRLPALQNLQSTIAQFEVRFQQNQRQRLSPASVTRATADLSQTADLAACLLASDLLWNICNTMFSNGPHRPKALGWSTSERPEQAVYSEPTDFVKDFCEIHTAFQPGLPIRRTVLAWVNRWPERFYKLLLEPWPNQWRPHSQSPTPLADCAFAEQIKLLAWSIYAHWLVLTILIERECWWIGDMGVSDITKIRNVLRQVTIVDDRGHSRAFLDDQHWWPWVMCTAAQQLHRQ